MREWPLANGAQLKCVNRFEIWEATPNEEADQIVRHQARRKGTQADTRESRREEDSEEEGRKGLEKGSS
jgi:hypothetical protein